MFPPGSPIGADLNGDGFIGLDDLDILLGNWNGGTQQAAWDLPQDLPGDLNGDGYVALDDLDIIFNNYYEYVTPGALLEGDISGDGFTGMDDYSIVLAHWNTGHPANHRRARAGFRLQYCWLVGWCFANAKPEPIRNHAML